MTHTVPWDASQVLPWRAGLAYGLLGLPLAFAALPLYVVLPHYYASNLGLPLASVGALLYGMRFTMLFFYVGLVLIIFGILGKFMLETYKLMNTLLFGDLGKIDLIIKVLELVDMTMVAQLVWVVALAGVSLFVTTGHFDSKDMKKPDWLDHVNTYNLKLKLAFAIISISGVHALKTYLSGELTLENIQVVTMVAVIHFTFVLSAIGISFAERLTREKD